MLTDHHAMDFFCDSMKLLINGSAKIDEIDQVMDMDLDVHHAESAAPGVAVNTMADGMPASVALAAASYDGRRRLGLPTWEEGAPADFVVYTADPEEDISVTAQPAVVLIDGIRARL